ncbi:MAG: DUF2470 domain-containing protein [Pseudomonadales bacterium]|nr:DUF2470 domain-containing protein [Pseudomonadales bacterium]MBO6823098.1 DUF2470 domain-containing protein [Pseudomonadales bacterium]
MNEDHADALLLYAHAFANRKDITNAYMVDLTDSEIVLEIPQGETLRVSLIEPVNTAEDAHRVLVAMVGEARNILSS